MSINCPLGDNPNCRLSEGERRREDTGIQRILDRMDDRFDRIDLRLDKFQGALTDVKVESGEHKAEISNLKEHNKTQDIHKWGVIVAVLGAWAAHFFNWMIKGGK